MQYGNREETKIEILLETRGGRRGGHGLGLSLLEKHWLFEWSVPDNIFAFHERDLGRFARRIGVWSVRRIADRQKSS